MKINKLFCLLLCVLALLFSGCAPFQRHPSSVVVDVAGEPEKDENLAQEIVQSSQILEVDPEKEAEAPLLIPLEINKRVAAWIHFFSVRKRDMTIRYFERGSALRPEIERILEANDVPKQLYFLAMIESGFVMKARSRAKATGVWQFMKGTGKAYGLKVGNGVDERRNWIKSTEAAISYLKDLHNVFGSWYLAFAAYNAGEHRIVRSIMRGKSRDFWALAEGKMLPRETLNYIPKFLAAVLIGQNPKKYGIEYTVQPPYGEYEEVTVPAGVSLRRISKVSGVPLAELRKWNIDLYRGHSAYSRSGSTEIFIPKSYLGSFEKNRKQLAKLKSRTNRRYARSSKSKSGLRVYVVRRGDTLSTISQRLKMSTRSLMKINGLRRTKIHPGQRLKYFSKIGRSKKTKTYVVKPNETLNGIANRHKTTVRKIRELNKNVKSEKIYAGQSLRMPASFSGSGYHTIQGGENLHTIARRYKTSINKLKSLNGIRGSRVYAGQRILVK